MHWTGFAIPLTLITSTALAQPVVVFDDFDSLVNDEIGGARITTLDVIANPFSQNTDFDVNPGFVFEDTAGAMVFNSGLAVQQTGEISWGTQEDLNLDLSEMLGIVLDFLQVDQSFQMSLDATSNSSSQTASWMGTVNATAIATSVLIGFDEFSVSEGFDATDVDSFTIRFNTGTPVASLDFVLGEIRSVAVPAPATGLLLGTAGLLVGRRRRR